MSLFKNETDHWEIPGNGELYSGDLVQVKLHGHWVSAWIDYRPRAGYSLRLEDGQIFPMDEQMEILPCIESNMRLDAKCVSGD